MKILMVCLGNICRSPLAEGILQQKIDAYGLDWQVDSAGTGGWHAGERPDRRSIAIAALHGIDISKQRARQFQASDVAQFDRIFVMDTQNQREVLRQIPTPEDRQKVDLILNQLYPGENRIVPDPYYDDDGFEQVFQMLEKACDRFVKAALDQP